MLSISGASEFTQRFFVEFVLLNLQLVRKDMDVSEVFCGSLFGFFCHFFPLTIVLSVFLRFRLSYYTFSIFKLFIHTKEYMGRYVSQIYCL